MDAPKRRCPLKLLAGPPITDPLQAIAAATAAVPQLAPHGMGMEKEGREFCLECVSTAMAMLRQCRRARVAKWSSYWLKHVAEHWGRAHGMASYVANGDLIVAALALGIPMTWDGVSQNVAIAISRTDAERLDPQA